MISRALEGQGFCLWSCWKTSLAGALHLGILSWLLQGQRWDFIRNRKPEIFSEQSSLHLASMRWNWELKDFISPIPLPITICSFPNSFMLCLRTLIYADVDLVCYFRGKRALCLAPFLESTQCINTHSVFVQWSYPSWAYHINSCSFYPLLFSSSSLLLPGVVQCIAT